MIYYKGQPVSGGSSGETYSTEETVIGTWIDGKPLYRKCFQANNYTIALNVWHDFVIMPDDTEMS